MHDRMHTALNEQVNHELQAFYTYLSMSSWFEAENLPGFAEWMRGQADEEKAHAERLIRHMEDRNARVEFDALERPPHDFDQPVEVMRAALEHEKEVTSQIHELVDVAEEIGDPAAESMLEWFVDEQVEEERTFTVLIGQLERAGDSGAGLMLMDDRLGQRGGSGEDGEGDAGEEA